MKSSNPWLISFKPSVSHSWSLSRNVLLNIINKYLTRNSFGDNVLSATRWLLISCKFCIKMRFKLPYIDGDFISFRRFKRQGYGCFYFISQSCVCIALSSDLSLDSSYPFFFSSMNNTMCFVKCRNAFYCLKISVDRFYTPLTCAMFTIHLFECYFFDR